MCADSEFIKQLCVITMKTYMYLALMTLSLVIHFSEGSAIDNCGPPPEPPIAKPSQPTVCRQMGGVCIHEDCPCEGYERFDMCPGEYRKCCLPGAPVNFCCEIFADPHIRTFDGFYYSIQVPGWFTISEPCESDHFKALAYFDYPYAGASWTKTVSVKVLYNNKEIVIHEDGTVTVDGATVTLEFMMGPIKISKTGDVICIDLLNIQVRICYNTATMRVRVYVGSRWKGKLCGVCGNFNEDIRDDNFVVEGGQEIACPHPLDHQSWQDCTRELKEIAGENCSFASFQRYLIPCAFDACADGDIGSSLTLEAAREECSSNGTVFEEGD